MRVLNVNFADEKGGASPLALSQGCAIRESLCLAYAGGFLHLVVHAHLG